MQPRRAPAPGAQLLPASVLLLLLLGAGPHGGCLAGPVPAAPLPAPGPCASQPCGNGGVCTPRPAPGPQSPDSADEAGYRCACPAGVFGANCQVSGRGGRGARGAAPARDPGLLPARSSARGSSLFPFGKGMDTASGPRGCGPPVRPCKCHLPAHPGSLALPAPGSWGAPLPGLAVPLAPVPARPLATEWRAPADPGRATLRRSAESVPAVAARRPQLRAPPARRSRQPLLPVPRNLRVPRLCGAGGR